ncbi:dihydrofolate reductase [Nitrospira defluvii]|nr:dihydrofolate reductase [Nitrospira defluvii]
MQPFSMIVAMDAERGIGKDGTLPWHLSGDLKHFKQLTCTTDDSNKQNAVIMGRKTWESIPEKFRPLPGRLNVVLTRNKKLNLPEGVVSADSLEKAFHVIEVPERKTSIEKAFVIGGAQIFEIALASPFCEELHVTHINSTFQCDTFFPPFESLFERYKTYSGLSEEDISYNFAAYRRKKT